MDEPIRMDRTWLCSVVFMDIVGYSRQSLEIQMNWKNRFNHYLSEAIKECPENERVLLDTGDGAAICFLGDPEMAMFCALRFVGAVGQETMPLHVRIGINLGSVKLVKDLNGNLNAVGDGINVGQRVMSFAADNQILVSRSFYEVASSLSEEYAGLFRYVGVQKDKHVREHTLYELHAPDLRNLAAEADSTELRSVLLTVDQITRVENSLAAIIGPIARHMVRNAAERMVSLGALRDSLLALIEAKADQESFLGECGNILTASPSSATPGASPLKPPEDSGFIWKGEVLEKARKDLAEFVGPTARVLVHRAAARTRTRMELYRLLSEEIASPKEREEFLRLLKE